MSRRWRRFCVYYTAQGAEVRHTPAFATRREAERYAEDLRVRVGITDVFVKYTDTST
jgi:hypothetical protein